MKSLAQILSKLRLNPRTLETEEIYLPMHKVFSYTAEKPRAYCKEAVIFHRLGINVTFSGQELGATDLWLFESIYAAPKSFGRVSMASLLEFLGVKNTPKNRKIVIDSFNRLKYVLFSINWCFEDYETFSRPYRRIVMYLFKTANFKDGLFYFELENRIKIYEQDAFKGLRLQVK